MGDAAGQASGGREPRVSSPPETGGSRPPLAAFRLARAALFVALLGLWTWKLLAPNPVPEDLRGELVRLELDFLAAKALHAGGYAVLTVLGGSVVPGRWRWAVAGLVALHGAATEAGQHLMAVGRHGCVRDVLIDAAGVALGALVLRWWGPGSRPDRAG